MAMVQVKITPSLAGLLKPGSSDWLIIEREISKGATIGVLLSALAVGSADFRKVLFDKDTGKVGDQVLVVLNDRLLQSPNVSETGLNDGDRVILIPVYTGG